MLDVRLPEKGIFKLPWREAGPLNHLDDKVDSDQQVVNKELSLSLPGNPFKGRESPSRWTTKVSGTPSWGGVT